NVILSVSTSLLRRTAKKSNKADSAVASLHTFAGYAAALRCELIERSRELAERNKIPHSFTYGELPAVIFEPYEEGQAHGNFMPATYRSIRANADWQRRLKKVHTQLAKSRSPFRDSRACELDSCTSSDALLMNIFCHPDANRSAHLRALL